MGLCQSIALRVVVHDTKNEKGVYKFSMKQLKMFRTYQDIFNLINVRPEYGDKIYCNNHVQLEEVHIRSIFQINNLVVKNGKIIKYRIFMEATY